MATLAKAATMLQKMWRGKVARRDMERKSGFVHALVGPGINRIVGINAGTWS